MRAALFVGSILAIAAAAPAHALTEEQIQWCENKGKQYPPDLEIGGCTAVIESGRWSGVNLSWAYFNRGNGHLRNKNYDRALSDYTRAIDLDPNYAMNYYNRGYVYQDQKDFRRAIQDYSSAIRISPSHAGSYFNRALAYEDVGERDNAIADFRKAHSLGHERAAGELRRMGATP